MVPRLLSWRCSLVKLPDAIYNLCQNFLLYPSRDIILCQKLPRLASIQSEVDRAKCMNNDSLGKVRPLWVNTE